MRAESGRGEGVAGGISVDGADCRGRSTVWRRGRLRSAPSGTADEALQQELKALAAQHHGKVALYATQLNTGGLWGWMRTWWCRRLR